MMSNTSRLLTSLNAVLYAILGACLFLFPAALAPVFAWKVTPFMTMTIGGWCLGNAWLAWIAARRGQWNLVYTSLLYLWIFGLGELLVLFGFRDKLVLVHPIAGLYVFMLVMNVIAAIVGLVDWIRTRPYPADTLTEAPTRTTQPIHRGFVVLFVLVVGFLGIYGATAPIGARGTNGGIFPEVMSLFTLRSFAVFYLSLAIGVVPLFWERNLGTFLTHGIASYGLILFITFAAVAHIRLFDFAAKPGGLIYLGAYLGVGIVLLLIFRKSGTGVPQAV